MKYFAKKRKVSKLSDPSVREAKVKKLNVLINKALACQDFNLAETLAFKLTSLTQIPETSLKYAHLLFMQKKYNQAKDIYAELVGKVENSLKAETLFGLGQVYFELKEFSLSFVNFYELVCNFKDFDCIGIAYIKLARILIRMNQYEQAEKYCQAVIDLNQEKKFNKGEAYALMAHIQHLLRNYDKSSELSKQALKSCTSLNILKLIIIGLVNLNPYLSEKICKKALKKEMSLKEWNEFYFLLAISYMKSKEFEKSSKILKELISFFEKNYYCLEYYGISLFNSGDKFEAFGIFEQVSRLFPYDSVNLSNFLIVYKEIQDCDGNENFINFTADQASGLRLKEVSGIVEPSLTIFSFPYLDE